MTHNPTRPHATTRRYRPRSLAIAGIATVTLASLTVACGGSTAPTAQSARPVSTPTTAATATTAATTSTAASTAPPPSPAPTTGASSAATDPTTAPTNPPPPQATPDWANFTYPISCENIENDSITLVNGTADPDQVDHFAYVSLLSTSDAGDGLTVVQLRCAISATVDTVRVLLMNGDGSVVDQLELENDKVSDMVFRESVFEGWEDGNSSASAKLVTVSVTDRKLVQQTGDTLPRCAGVGIVNEPDPGPLNDGVNINSQGELVRGLQNRLIELGHGGPIEATGGADGRFGLGTMLAVQDYNGAFASDEEWKIRLQPAGADEPGWDPGIYFVTTSEVRDELGVACTGEFRL